MFDSNLSGASDSLNQFADPIYTGLSDNGEISNLFASPSGISRLIADAQASLQAISTSPDLMTKLEIAFGTDFDRGIANSLFQHFASGDFSVLPTVEILPDPVLPGANGAFAVATDRVYLSDRFVTENAAKPDAIMGVLLEEYGHAIDSLINVADSPGDEGEIFAAIAQGKPLDENQLRKMKAEDDTATISIDGKAIRVEQAIGLGNAANNWSGGSGNDDVSGEGGNDTLYGNGGNDKLYGGGNDDRIWGGPGADSLWGETGADRLIGDDGNDELRGGDDNDSLWGSGNDDKLWGENGNDQLRGDDGSDELRGGNNEDTLWGGGNDDKLWGEDGNDELRGENGNDELRGGNGNDRIYGGDNEDRLWGEVGNDELRGENGSDILEGYGLGTNEQDTLYGGANADRFVLGNASNIYYWQNYGNDFAVLPDFNPNEDVIQLKRLSSSISGPSQAFGYSLVPVGSNTEIRVDSNGDLIGKIQGVLNLSLTGRAFTFEGSAPPSSTQTTIPQGSGILNPIIQNPTAAQIPTTTPTIPDFAGNTREAAKNLNVPIFTGNSAMVFDRDWVGPQDPTDYYRFTLNQRLDFKLEMKGMTADADVRLLNDAGTAFAWSQNPGNNSETINRTLDAGTYYINVYGYGNASTYYDLGVSAQSIAPPDNAGSSPSVARSITIPVNGTKATFSDYVGSQDGMDYYRFTLDKNVEVNLNLTGLSSTGTTKNAYIQLMDVNNTVIANPTPPNWNKNELTSIKRSLSAGTYYARVRPFGGSSATGTNYTLEASTSGPAATVAITAETINPVPDIDIQLGFFGNFTQSQKELIEKAAQNWRNIITRDMVPDGKLNIAVTQASTSLSGDQWSVWAETGFPSTYPAGTIATPNQRYNLPYPSYDNNPSGIDYHTRILFNSNKLPSLTSNELVRLATHEIGHALYLDEAQNDGTLGLDGIMDKNSPSTISETNGLDMKITDGIYQRLEYLGYSVNRNPSLSWS